MKKILLSFLLIFICMTWGFAQGIKFETGTWSEMLAKAKTENKLVFVDVYTQWCGPCKNVAKNVFPQQKLGDVYKELEKRYGYVVDDSEKGDLATEAERMCLKLAKDMFNNEFLFITDYSAEKRAFYHMRDDNGTPLGYDLIWKGTEITTGAQREHRYDILTKQANEKG